MALSYKNEINMLLPNISWHQFALTSNSPLHIVNSKCWLSPEVADFLLPKKDEDSCQR